MQDERNKMKNRNILVAVPSLIREHAGPLGRMTSALFLMVFVLLPTLIFAPSPLNPTSPTLAFEDPVYSMNTTGTFHRVISAAPGNGTFVINISSSVNGSGWIYARVIKFDTPSCAGLGTPDASKILLVKNSINIADTSPSGCPQVNGSYAGVIFEDNSCGTNSKCNLSASPYAYNFISPIYNNIANASYVLLNGKYHVVQNISVLRGFYLNGYYEASNYAPSFLMRLSGQFTPSPYGIESFVNINQFEIPGTPNFAIDYYYFNSSLNPMLYQMYEIKGMPNCENINACTNMMIPHFYLDNGIDSANSSGVYTHLQIYVSDVSLVAQ